MNISSGSLGKKKKLKVSGQPHLEKVHSTEPPWITSLKNLLQKRQSALSRGDDQMFRELRNRVNRERKMCRANCYQAKVQHLKKYKPSEWWKEVKKLNLVGALLPSQPKATP